MLIQRLLPLVFLFLATPVLAQADGSPDSNPISSNNALNGNLGNNPPPAAQEAPAPVAPMVPVPPENEPGESPSAPAPGEPEMAPSPGEPTAPAAPTEGQPPAAAPSGPAPESQAPGELQVPPEEAPLPREAGVPMPTRGMTMKEVEEKFGAPELKRPAVGEPPITRWVYADYTVYFEHQYVIHSVPNSLSAPVQPESP